jgi:hypothetical protein
MSRTSEHAWIAWFPSKLCMAQNDKPFKTMKQCTKRQARVLYYSHGLSLNSHII